MPTDKLDIKILEKLDANLRSGNKQIAKELNVQRQVVDYRIKRMETSGVIIQYRMLANLTKLGFIYHRLHVKLQSTTPVQKENLFKYLANNHKIVWLVECDGKYDLMVGIISLNLTEFRATLFDFLEKFQDQIEKYDVVQIIELIVPSRDFTGTKHLRSVKGAIMDQSDSVKLSEIDKQIINELAANGRQTVVELSKKIKEPVEKVNYHLKQIINQKIVFSNIQFGYSFLGFELYKTLLHLKKPERKRIEELKRFARSYPRVWDIVETMGKWQLELDIESKGHEDYYKIMDAIQTNFSDIIANYDTLFVRREKKFLFSVF